MTTTMRVTINHKNVGLILTEDSAPVVRQLADRIAVSATNLGGSGTVMGRDDGTSGRGRTKRARSAVIVEKGGTDAVQALRAAMEVAG